MAAYEYKALTADGRRTSGVISADNPRSARRELRARQLTPVEVEESGQSRSRGARLRGRLSHKQRTLFTRQMAVLLQSGMTVEQALTAAAADGSAASVKALILGVRAQVMEGVTLSDSLRSTAQWCRRANPPASCRPCSTSSRPIWSAPTRWPPPRGPRWSTRLSSA
jgi:general secretion pathway protein F